MNSPGSMVNDGMVDMTLNDIAYIFNPKPSPWAEYGIYKNGGPGRHS